MIPTSFGYFRPTTLDEAIHLLAQNEEAKVLAGGHSLLPAMKLRLAQPKTIIDLGRVAELNYIREEGGQIAIGAMTTHFEIESSKLLREKCPLLPEVAEHIGDVQVRIKGLSGAAWFMPIRLPIGLRRHSRWMSNLKSPVQTAAGWFELKISLSKSCRVRFKRMKS